MALRQLTEVQKNIDKQSQRESDGSLRCFISGNVINETDDIDEIEYDHIKPFVDENPTDLVNVRVVKKNYNRRKKDQSLYAVRDNFRLEMLFQSKKNHIKLDHIFKLKEIENQSIHSTIKDGKILMTNGSENREYSLLHDTILNTDYFYGKIPIRWIRNDNQEGLQPRVIDYKRLLSLRDHLKNNPQLAPAIARLIENRILLFDGQHKTAAQILCGTEEIDIRVFISPEQPDLSKKLFDQLMLTNLDAHSKHRQVPFYTSTLLERLSVIYKELWEEFSSTKPAEEHSEKNFIKYMTTHKNLQKSKARDIFVSAIKENVISKSPIERYIAEASKDINYPLTQDLIESALLPFCLYLQPSDAIFDSNNDYRNSEVDNFHVLSSILTEEGMLSKWVSRQKNAVLTQEQLKSRRIWHKGSLLTWGPYIKDIIINVFNIQTEPERERLLYRPRITEDQTQRMRAQLQRIFRHPMWDSPEGEIDTLLSSAKKQEDLFTRNRLTRTYVLTGLAQN